MLIKKEGMPEESELVVCTVTSVQHHSVFCRIDEYGSTGMIHISEVSPGRIRNIRDFVKEGKVIVCKVLRINRERGHVDLSLRRVTEGQRRAKLDRIKQEKSVEKIVEFVAKKLKKEPAALLQGLVDAVVEKYESVYAAFQAISEGDENLERLGVASEEAKELTEVINQRIKPQQVEIKGRLFITTYAPDGVNRIKSVLKKASETGAVIRYVGAGQYDLVVTAQNYKEAEAITKTASEAAVKPILKEGGKASFTRIE